MRVAILVMGMLIGLLTIAAASIEVNAAAMPAVVDAALQPTTSMGRDVAVNHGANHHGVSVNRGLHAGASVAVVSGVVPGEEAPRLASLDPSQIVYEYVQGPPKSAPVLLSGVTAADGRLFPVRELRVLPHQRPRTAGDFVLMGFAALMLVAYQLRRKHRVLRPHPFGL